MVVIKADFKLYTDHSEHFVDVNHFSYVFPMFVG